METIEITFKHTRDIFTKRSFKPFLTRLFPSLEYQGVE